MRPSVSRVAVLVLGGLAGLACAGCGDEETLPARPATDQPIVVDVGDEFSIELASNPTTGYRWELAAPLPGDVLVLVDETYIASDTDELGSGGREVFTFEAVGDGSTFIQLWYIRPFDDPPRPEGRAQYDVRVGTGVPPGTVDPSEVDEPDETVAPDPDALTVTELLAGVGSGEVTVQVVLFDDGSGLLMCEALAESFPPQCVGDRVPIANPETVDADFTQQDGIRWTDRPAFLIGTFDGREFTVIRS